MSCITADKLFFLEDKIMKHPGLYGMWTLLYLTNIICLAIDPTTGPTRDFNILSSILSTIYTAVSSYNTIYGNKMPSSMLLMAGPIHQYSTWLLLAYYRGDVYCDHSAVGYLNVVYTFIVGVFTLDMVIKTWKLAINSDYYLNYINKENPVLQA